MTPSDRWTLLDAAAMLELEARLLRESHTIPPEHKRWVINYGDDHIARENHDKLLATVAKLRAIAERENARP